MGSQESFSKKEREKKKRKKKEEKARRKEERKNNPEDKGENLTWVDEFGNFHDSPPRDKQKVDSQDIVLGVPKKTEEEFEETERSGVVTSYNDRKLFGFIKDKQSQQSVFFHISDCEEEVVENNLVSFEIEMGPKGPAAKKVKVIR